MQEKRFENAKSIYSELKDDEIALVDLHCASIAQSKYFSRVFRFTSRSPLSCKVSNQNHSNKYRSLSFQLTINRAPYF